MMNSLSVNIVISLLLNVMPKIYGQNDRACQELADEPFFNSDMVIGKPWRVYYSQNVKMEVHCYDLKFKPATPMIIWRIYDDMHEFLDEKLAWASAALLLLMGPSKNEVLLFPVKGVPGKFMGVANVARSRDFNPSKGTVPLLKFQMKILNGGKFLVFMDCHIGVTTISARLGEVPYRAEIAGAASQIGLDHGFQACLKDKNPNESIPNTPAKETVRVVVG